MKAKDRRIMSGQVQRLARRLGRSPDELAARYGEDVVRRTKFPVIEKVDENGARTFTHPLDIETKKLF